MAQKLVCTACGHLGEPRVTTKGSTLIEIILWCFFLVPGIIYSIWRRSKKPKVCRVCGGTALIPQSSPMAQKMIANKEIDDSPDIKTVSEDAMPLVKKGGPIVLMGIGAFTLIGGTVWAWMMGLSFIVLGVLLHPNTWALLQRKLQLGKGLKITLVSLFSAFLFVGYPLYLVLS